MKQTLYEILGAEPDATLADIKAAHRAKQKVWRPDVPGGDREVFERIQQAYDVLSDDGRRAHYDSTGDGGTKANDEERIETEALKTLAHFIREAVMFCPDVKMRNIRDDLVRAGREKVEEFKAELAKNRTVVEKAEVMSLRFVLKGPGDDILMPIILERIKAAKLNVREYEIMVAAYERAIDIFLLYDYRTDTLPSFFMDRTHMGGGTYISTSST